MQLKLVGVFIITLVAQSRQLFLAQGVCTGPGNQWLTALSCSCTGTILIGLGQILQPSNWLRVDCTDSRVYHIGQQCPDVGSIETATVLWWPGGTFKGSYLYLLGILLNLWDLYSAFYNFGAFGRDCPTLTSDFRKTGIGIGIGFTIASFSCLTGPPLGGALIAKSHGRRFEVDLPSCSAP
ncbi:hypothetical protein VI817_003572 [Penicillium citrinum]|nr:hypothetical protein VI817_003572 [Penicillium citrinum]